MIILGTNSIKDTGYDVANSVRFNDGDDPRLKIANPTAGVRTKGTFSTWFKRCTSGAVQYFFSTWNNATDGYSSALIYLNSDKLHFNNYLTSGESTHTNLILPRLFRDPSAWSHIVCAWDTTLGTSTDRVKIYVNGVRETNFTGTVRYPQQNEQLFFQIGGTANPQHIGYQSDGGGRNFDGYLAETVYVEGTALAADQFGEFDDDSGIWKPIDVSGLTAGTNGFYLDFEASGNLGNDAFGGTDLTEVNLAATDQSTDTCTNNFCTMNPLGSGAVTFSEGNLQVTKSGSGFLNAIANIGASSGKWYAEAKAISIGSVTYGSYIGFINLDVANKQNTTGDIGDSPAGSTGISSGGGYIYYNGSQFTGATTATTNGDIVNLAMDLDNGRLYWGINGTYVNSGNPASGSTGTGGMPIANIVANGTYTFAVSLREGANYSWNFGSPNHAISSGNADGNGYGNFEYAVPSGYFALNTKNLAEYG